VLSSKIGLSLFCEKHNILAPAFVNYNNIDDQIKIKTKLTFPVVVKRDFSSAGADMFISNSYDELILKLNNTIGSNKVMIQDLIEGNEIHVEALFYKGYLLSYQNSDTIERATDQFSYRTRKQYYRNADLAPLLIY
jgi:phosphoribosylamine-glycine ligase